MVSINRARNGLNSQGQEWSLLTGPGMVSIHRARARARARAMVSIKRARNGLYSQESKK